MFPEKVDRVKRKHLEEKEVKESQNEAKESLQKEFFPHFLD